MISRVMPGKKDFVPVTADGEKSHKQKRVILCNLKEAFVAFKEEHPDENIHFSKFAELRPKECFGGGEWYTQRLCLQHTGSVLHTSKYETYDQWLMKLSQISDGQFQDYRDCLAALRCDPPIEDTFMSMMKKLQTHDFIAKQQSKFLQTCKDNLESGP